MRNIIATQRQLRLTLIGLILGAVAGVTLAVVWPAAAHDINPRSHDAVGYTRSDPNATPWAPVKNQREATARGLLAQRLGVPAESLELVSEEVVNWPDTSLGCPEPGHVYAKVIVPGHRITFAHDGANYEVHTADKSGFGQYFPPVSCEGGLAYDRAAGHPAG